MDNLNQLLVALKIRGQVVKIQEGLRTRRYFIKLKIGEKVSKIKSISDEITLVVGSLTVPQIYIDTQSKCVVVETTFDDKPLDISLEEILKVSNLEDYSLPLVIGKTMQGTALILDLSTSPHILVGGTTGSGKSILMKTMIRSLLYKYPSEKDLQFIFVDPKGTELVQHKNSSHTGVYITKQEEIPNLLEQSIRIMETRYE